jgi:hypothetical protein
VSITIENTVAMKTAVPLSAARKSAEGEETGSTTDFAGVLSEELGSALLAGKKVEPGTAETNAVANLAGGKADKPAAKAASTAGKGTPQAAERLRSKEGSTTSGWARSKAEKRIATLDDASGTTAPAPAFQTIADLRRAGDESLPESSGTKGSEASAPVPASFHPVPVQSELPSLIPAAATSGNSSTSSAQLTAVGQRSSEKAAANPTTSSQGIVTEAAELQAQLGPAQKLQQALPLKDPPEGRSAESQAGPTRADIAVTSGITATVTATVTEVSLQTAAGAASTAADIASAGAASVDSRLVAYSETTVQSGQSVAKGANNLDSRFKTSLEAQPGGRKQSPLLLDATPSTAGREAAQSPAIPMLPSDSAQLRDSTSQSPTPSHGRAGETLAQDPFAVMDAALKEQPAQLLHASPREVDVGVHDATYGWVEIKTHLAGGQLNASLAASSHEAQHVLQTQLPALAEYLSNHAIQVDRLSLGSSSTTTAGESGGENRESGAEGQEKVPLGIVSAASNPPRQNAAEVESNLPLEYRRNLRVDVMA